MGTIDSSARLVSPFAPARAGEISGRQLVAAVCYRVGTRGIEFLLVRTRGGRWIFPKGGVVPGLTCAQSAAHEAFEEAGVHGRIEEMPFARYRHGKLKDDRRKSRSETTKPVAAHLCEVSRLERPQEENRKPTWFTAEKAKRRLVEDRSPEFGDELASVVDRAVARIRRLEVGTGDRKRDALQTVRLEAFENSRSPGRRPQARLIRYLMLERPTLPVPTRLRGGQNGRDHATVGKLLQLGTGQCPKAQLPAGTGNRGK